MAQEIIDLTSERLGLPPGEARPPDPERGPVRRM